MEKLKKNKIVIGIVAALVLANIIAYFLSIEFIENNKFIFLIYSAGLLIFFHLLTRKDKTNKK